MPPNNPVERHEIEELKGITSDVLKGIAELTTEVKLLVQSHAQTNEKYEKLEATINKRFDKADERFNAHTARLRDLENFKASSEPVILNVRDLGNKMITRIIIGFMSIGSLGAFAAWIAKT